MKDDPITDTILIERFQNGDASAMDALIRRHQERAYKFASHLAKDRDLAADVVADAFVRMYRSTDSFRGQSTFTTWMYRIITNCFLDRNKKAKRNPTMSLDYFMTSRDGGSNQGSEGTALTPFDEIVTREQKRSIDARLTDLSEFHRVMIVMYHVEMLSYEEIAQALDLPIGTVKSRLNRARLNLRSNLLPQKSLFGFQSGKRSQSIPSVRMD